MTNRLIFSFQEPRELGPEPSERVELLDGADQQHQEQLPVHHQQDDGQDDRWAQREEQPEQRHRSDGDGDDDDDADAVDRERAGGGADDTHQDFDRHDVELQRHDSTKRDTL